MTRKIYTKGARVLRAEVMIHNAKAYRGRRSLPGWGAIVTRRLGILESNRRSLAGTSLAAETPVPLDTLARMKLDSEAKADLTLVFSTRWRAWLRFSSDPWHWLAVRVREIGTDLTPLVSFS